MTVYIGRSLGHQSAPEAEHWLHGFALPVISACTHLVQEPFPHVALSLELPAPVRLPLQSRDLLAAAHHVAHEHEFGSSGRAFIYPGSASLTGFLTVAELIAASAISNVTVIGGGPCDPDTVVHTRDFVRPQWIDGVLTLIATPAPDGRIAPFEIPDPVDCC